MMLSTPSNFAILNAACCMEFNFSGLVTIEFISITPAEAEKRTDKNIITRAVGISVQIQPDIKPIGAVEGEIILLCSDGLSGMLTSDEIHGVAAREGATAEQKVKALVSLANDAGGDDNITVVIAEL